MINQTNTSRTASLVNNQQQHSQVSKPLLLNKKINFINIHTHRAQITGTNVCVFVVT